MVGDPRDRLAGLPAEARSRGRRTGPPVHGDGRPVYLAGGSPCGRHPRPRAPRSVRDAGDAGEGPNSEDVRAARDANAVFWDEQMESGGTWQQFLISRPSTRLYASAGRAGPGGRAGGEFARRMADWAARCWPPTSASRCWNGPGPRRRRQYRQADATDEARWRPGRGGIVRRGRLQHGADGHAGEIAGLCRLDAVRPGGKLPCPRSPGVQQRQFVLVTERSEDDGVPRRHYVKVSVRPAYVTKGIAVRAARPALLLPPVADGRVAPFLGRVRPRGPGRAGSAAGPRRPGRRGGRVPPGAAGDRPAAPPLTCGHPPVAPPG